MPKDGNQRQGPRMDAPLGARGRACAGAAEDAPAAAPDPRTAAALPARVRSAGFVSHSGGRGSPALPMTHTAEAEGAQAAPPTRAAPAAPARLRLLRPRALISSKRC